MEIDNIIKYDSESSCLDFKEQQYELGKSIKKNELLKDIMSFANHLSDNEKYIIIGVVEDNGMAKEFKSISKLTDEAKYQEFINNNIEPKIDFEYKSYEYNGCSLAYFRIINNNDRPYLFKKDIQNPVNGKIEFKKGDGFIRQGTSTHKMTRVDFDIIYEEKNSIKDRSSSVEISAYYRKLINQKIPNNKCTIIDLNIGNNSKKSIDLDIELQIYKKQGIIIMSEKDYNESFKEKTSKVISAFTPIVPEFHLPNINVQIEETDDYYKISKNHSLKLMQNYKSEKIYEEDLHLISGQDASISAEVFIRSDDFANGMIVKKIDFKIE